jgi:hypothetical protein
MQWAGAMLYLAARSSEMACSCQAALVEDRAVEGFELGGAGGWVGAEAEFRGHLEFVGDLGGGGGGLGDAGVVRLHDVTFREGIGQPWSGGRMHTTRVS